MPLVDIRSIVKSHGGLRPFRLRQLSVEAGDVVVLAGPDEQAAAVFTDLLTGTTLPDQGEILVAGRSTASLRTPDDWLAFLDSFGLVSARAVLLDQLTVAQNLAIARTLDVEPMSAETRDMASRMAAEVGLEAPALDVALAAGTALTRLRVLLGRQSRAELHLRSVGPSGAAGLRGLPRTGQQCHGRCVGVARRRAPESG